MTAIEIFRLIAQEFQDIADDKIKQYMELFSSQISKSRFGDTYEQALAYLTAHKLKMSGHGNTENGTIAESLKVSSYSEGETSISYTTNQQTNLTIDAEYALTVYGLEFLTLKRNAIVPIISSGEGLPNVSRN